jgi:signal transduction histidine kinase
LQFAVFNFHFAIALMSTRNPNPDHEGEVVYRRADSATRTGAVKALEARFDPALSPLLTGFALLLILVLVLGHLSVQKIEETSRTAFDLESGYATRLMLFGQLRAALIRLDNEARDRMEAKARKELAPPFDLRLSTARNEVSRQLPILDNAPSAEAAKWKAFRDNVADYIEITKDVARYNQDGYAKFRDVDIQLNQIIAESNNTQGQIISSIQANQQAAASSIRSWNLIAILIALVVTAGTVWQVQRRFYQQRLSTEAARREREFNNQMLEGMVSAIAAIDRRDRIRSANAAFFRIFPEARVGASIHNPDWPAESAKLLEAVTASHVDKATYRGRWNLNGGHEGRSFDVYSSPLEIDNEHGQILTLVDVTEAAKAEAALRQGQALAAVGEAAAQLAHEIKNPLGSIRLGIEMLREYTKNGEALRTIELVERGIHHLNKLVVDVTQFSRHRQLERADAELHEVINSSIDLVADRIQEKQTRIEKSFTAKDIEGYWDSEQLREVFVNLLANAIDASGENTPVEISTTLVASSPETIGRPVVETESGSIQRVTVPKANRARVVVRDHGSGMDAKTKARLFEPFFTTKKRGTGLGMSVVRQIIELHGGTIDVQSEPAKGTTFTIELPLTTNDNQLVT